MATQTTETRPEYRPETREPERRPHYTWTPTAGGVLSIISGAIGIIGGILALTIGQTFLADMLGFIPGGPAVLIGGSIAALFGILAVIGGVFSLRRRVWGMALTGSILSVFLVWFLGIPAIIFVALGRREFSDMGW